MNLPRTLNLTWLLRMAQRPTSNGEWLGILRSEPCCYCQRKGGTVEHVIPKRDGGAKGADNMVGACAGCNEQRGHKPLLRFLLQAHRERVKRRPGLATLEQLARRR